MELAEGAARRGVAGRGLARTAAEAVVFGVLPAGILAGGLLSAVSASGALYDYGLVAGAAERIVDGVSPYLPPAELDQGGEYLYPPLAALLAVPLQALPATAAQGIVYVLWLGCIVGALLLLGVRDWRCHTVALVGSPVTACLKLGTLGPPLLLGIAIAWRVRERAVPSGAALGLASALKVFTWPLLVWPALAGRARTTLVALAVAAAACLASWAAIGFAGLADYPETLREASRIWGPQSYSLVALGVGLDVPRSVATALALVAALAMLALGRRLARNAARPEAVLLTACIAAALLATPILWEHYLVLLLVPIALAAPRLSALWFVPVALEAVRLPAWSHGELRHIVPLLATTALVVAWSLVGMRRRDAWV